MALIPIKVKIKRGGKGAEYPPFNKVDRVFRGGIDWAYFFDRCGGTSWCYDKVDALGNDASATEEHAYICLPEEFVAACEAIPAIAISIARVSEAEMETFYETKSTIKQETEFLDADVLAGIKARIDLENDVSAPTVDPGVEILALRAKCLDPSEQNYRGIRKNMRKKWEDFKATIKMGDIHVDYRKP